MKKPTLSDVAALAGVSTGTVSKYINGIYVSPKNKQSVQFAIDQLGYAPNTLAKSFASGKASTILLVIITEYPIVSSTWLYELPIILGLTEAFENSGYSMRIELENLNQPEENYHRLDYYSKSHFVDAFVILSAFEITQKLLLPLQYHEIPFVAIGSNSHGFNDSFIDFDNQQPIHDIVKKMYELGGRRFALIGGFENQRQMLYRKKGYLKGLAELDLEIDESRIVSGDYSLQSGYENALRLFSQKNPPDSIICGNDYIAAGVIKAAKEKKISIPGDVLLSGFDNTAVSESTDPTITTVDVPSMEMGHTAGKEILKKIADSSYSIDNRLLECKILFKGSTNR